MLGQTCADRNYIAMIAHTMPQTFQCGGNASRSISVRPHQATRLARPGLNRGTDQITIQRHCKRLHECECFVGAIFGCQQVFIKMDN
jgi:hypothetical protein